MTKTGGTEAREQKTSKTQAHTGRAGPSNSLQLLPHARSSGRRPLYLGAHWRIVGTSGPTMVYVYQSTDEICTACYSRFVSPFAALAV